MMRKYLTLLILFTLTLSGSLIAQGITVSASIDSTQIWIGQQTRLHFDFSQQPDQRVQTPIFSEVIIDGLEMIEPPVSDTVKKADGYLQIRQSYLITSFEDSLYLIPSYPFVQGDDTIWSPSLSLKVVQPFEIDTTRKEIADIKPVLTPRFSFKYLIKKVLPWIVGGLLVAALIFVAYRLYKNKPVLVPQVKEVKIPAHVIALQKLEAIRQEKQWQNHRHKEYHTQLTDVLREYIENIYELPALEMTSDEILTHLNYLRSEQKEAYLQLQQILRLADLIKFAKWNVGPDEHELSLTNAIAFVNHTKIEEKKEDDIS